MAAILPEQNNSDTVLVQSRFGEVFLHPERKITFDNSLLGFVGQLDFCLIDFPRHPEGSFKLLQSLDADELSFVVLPIDINNNFIEEADILEVSNSLEINMEDLALLAIASLHSDLEGKKISINTKAPIFIDVKNKTARQCVLPNNKYQIRTYM